MIIGKIMMIQNSSSKESVEYLISKKIMELKEIKENSNYLFDIEADGNINEETIILCHSSGANIFVSGGYVFGHNNPELRIKKLKNILSNGKVE